MKKSEKIRIVMFSLVFVSLIIIAMPLAGVGDVNTASATSDDGPGIPEDYYAKTLKWLEQTTSGPMDFFESEDESLNEIIKTPDEITKMLEKISEPYEEIEGKVKASPTAVAVWLTALSTKKLVKPYLVFLDVDGDGKPEQLAAIYNYPYTDTVAAVEFEPQLEGHFKKMPYKYVDADKDFGYVINPFEMPEKNLGNICELVYIKNPDRIKILPKKTITVDELKGKTPRELGLDKYDRFVSKTPGAPDEVPTGEEVTPTPGFEVLFAIAELLVVAYIFRKRK
jgi:hypothetical protein